MSRQRTLTSLELNWSEIPIDDMLNQGSKSLLRGFEKVNSLKIMPGIHESMSQAALDFFRSHPEIQNLALHFWHMEPNYDHDQEQNAAQTSKGALKAFLTGIEPSTFCLRTLTLADVDLRGCQREWISALNFDALSELTLSNCIHPQDFLKAVTKTTTNSPLHLKSFILYQSQAWDDGPTLLPSPLVSKVNKFLNGVSKSICDLWICLRGFPDLPDAATIAKHGETLLWLFIDVRERRSSEGIAYPIREWETLCRSLVKVQQVDVVYPHVEAACQNHEYGMFRDHVVSFFSIVLLRP